MRTYTTVGWVVVRYDGDYYTGDGAPPSKYASDAHLFTSEVEAKAKAYDLDGEVRDHYEWRPS